MLKPTKLKDKFGKTVYVGSILKARLVFGDVDVVGRVELDENDEPILVQGLKKWPLRNVSIYGEVFRA